MNGPIQPDGDGISEIDAREANDPRVGSGTPDTAPLEDPPTTLVERQPVRLIAETPTAVLGLAGAIVALGVGDPLLALALALGVVVVLALLELARLKVTPVARPRLDADIPLTPGPPLD